MSTPAARLRLAIYLALGFILFRAGYAILFSGAYSADIVLPLPGIRLTGIFSHVQLLGPVGLSGLVRAVSSALPFALLILVFGALLSLIKPSWLIAAASRSSSNLLTTFGIGMVALASLLEAAKRIRTAMKLRSERAISGLVPLLETSLERSQLVAARLEGSKVVGDVQAPTLIAKSLKIRGLSVTDFELAPGQALVVAGPTGSGKSTLLRAVLGLESKFAGELKVLGLHPQQRRKLGNRIAFLPQQPRDWFLGERVADELAAGEDSAPIEQLSEGQAAWLGIRLAMAAKPQLLVLDEPFAALDHQKRIELNELLNQHLAAGGMLLLAEHNLEAIKFEHQLISLPGSGESEPRPPLAKRSLGQVVGELSAAGIHGLKLPGISVCAQEIVAVVGPNGSGKTTLLTLLERESVQSRLVPERVEDFFVRATVQGELARTDQLAKVTDGFTKTTLLSLLPSLEGQLELHPRDLSQGSKLALAISMQLSHKPKLLLLDEPSKGLDPLARERLIHVLQCVAEVGCAVVFATQDRHLASLADRRLELA